MKKEIFSESFKKTYFYLISILAILILLIASSFYSANATVSISISDGAVAYGNMPVSVSKNTLSGDLNDMQTVTNNSSVAVDLDIKGQDATGGGCTWTLSSTSGSNQYVHQFCNDTDDDCSSPPTNYTALTTDYQTLKENVSASGTVDFHLRLTTPTSSSCGGEQNVNVTVLASGVEPGWPDGDGYVYNEGEHEEMWQQGANWGGGFSKEEDHLLITCTGRGCHDAAVTTETVDLADWDYVKAELEGRPTMAIDVSGLSDSLYVRVHIKDYPRSASIYLIVSDDQTGDFGVYDARAEQSIQKYTAEKVLKVWLE